MRTLEKHLPALADFASEMVRSNDIDPLYPVLRELYGLMELTEEQALWFTTLYLAYYKLPSALAAFREGYNLGLERFPCATERRGLRGGAVVRHLADYRQAVAAYPSQEAWITRDWGDDPTENYLAFWGTAQTVWGNGRWASFKWSELLKEVHFFNLEAPDMRLEFCSGPKEGLCWLYDLPLTTSVSQLNACALDLQVRLAERHQGRRLTWEELETILCNFNSLRRGRYYIGHDIDELQEAIDQAVFLDPSDKVLLEQARSLALPREYLGEHWGRRGIDRKRMSAYQKGGVLLDRRNP